MVGSLSDYAENQIIRFIFTAAAISRPTSWQMGVHTAAPGDASGANESDLPRASMTFGAPVLGKSATTNQQVFDATELGSAYNLRYWSVWGNSVNYLGWGTFVASARLGGFSTVNNDRNPRPLIVTFPAGQAVVNARGLSAYGKTLALNWLFRTASVTRPTQWWMAVHRMPPDENGVGGELSGAGATREQVTFSVPSNGVAANSSIVTFGPSVGGWPRLSHFSIWDASVGGNCLIARPFKTPYDVGNLESLRFAVGDITVRAA